MLQFRFTGLFFKGCPATRHWPASQTLRHSFLMPTSPVIGRNQQESCGVYTGIISIFMLLLCRAARSTYYRKYYPTYRLLARTTCTYMPGNAAPSSPTLTPPAIAALIRRPTQKGEEKT